MKHDAGYLNYGLGFWNRGVRAIATFDPRVPFGWSIIDLEITRGVVAYYYPIPPVHFGWTIIDPEN